MTYSWLANQNLFVNPRRHALYYRDQDVSVYMPGVGKSNGRTSHVVSIRIEQISGITPPELDEPETPPKSQTQVQFSESQQSQSGRVTTVAPIRRGSRRRKDPQERLHLGTCPLRQKSQGRARRLVDGTHPQLLQWPHRCQTLQPSRLLLKGRLRSRQTPPDQASPCPKSHRNTPQWESPPYLQH